MSDQPPVDLEAIRARLSAITQGEWINTREIVLEGRSPQDSAHTPATVRCLDTDEQQRRRTRFIAACQGTGCNRDADAEFIAHAPSDVAALFAEISRLTRALEEAQQQIQAERELVEQDPAEQRAERYAMEAADVTRRLIAAENALEEAQHERDLWKQKAEQP